MPHSLPLLRDPESQALLSRYYAGQCSEAELQQVQSLLAASPLERLIVERLQQSPVRAADAQAACEAMLAKFNEPVTNLPRYKTNTAKTRRHGVHIATQTRQLWRGFGIAAAVVLAAIVTLHGYESDKQIPGETYHTAQGERTRVDFADGSSAMLAPQTTLTVTHHAGRQRNDITLRGEAYFDVHSSSRRPFVVHTGKITTEVLGTRFDVRYLDATSGTHVAVVSGRVRCANTRAEMVVNSGTVMRITDSSVAQRPSEALNEYTDWVSGRLEFYQTPLPEVLRTLERWYGIQFRVADASLNEGRLTARLDYQSTANMMAALKTLLGVQMTFDTVGTTQIVTLHKHAATAPIVRPIGPSQPFTVHTGVGR